MLFVGNSTSAMGGAIYPDAIITVSYVDFENNAGSGGGALRTNVKTVTLTDVSFSGNTATSGNGGAVMGFDIWEVAENATLTSTLASTVEDDYAIDLDGVTLDFGSATDGWNIATAESGIINLADATIKLGSVAWAWNETDNCWYGDTNQWKLSVADNTLTLSKLA